MDSTLWAALPETVRQRIDGLIAQDRRIHAVAALREALPEPKPGLYDCLDTVAWRYRELGQRFELWPTPPLDVEQLTRTVRGLAGALVAIEASWDGDTFGWYVQLTAKLVAPSREHLLASVRHGGDARLFTGEVPPWPEAQEANAIGRTLADRLAVPFHPADPDAPSIDDPNIPGTP
jgi:hypothetical protein